MTLTSENILRVCRFRPYRKGMGPVFKLTTWDTNRRDHYGKYVLGYRLSIGEKRDQNVIGNSAVWTVLFEGEDFGCSPIDAIDSDAAVEGIMSFLTLQPGDTDSEYFADYTPAQLDYCSSHAEALSACVQDRYCDENGNVKRKGNR